MGQRGWGMAALEGTGPHAYRVHRSHRKLSPDLPVKGWAVSPVCGSTTYLGWGIPPRDMEMFPMEYIDMRQYPLSLRLPSGKSF